MARGKTKHKQKQMQRASHNTAQKERCCKKPQGWVGGENTQVSDTEHKTSHATLGLPTGNLGNPRKMPKSSRRFP